MLESQVSSKFAPAERAVSTPNSIAILGGGPIATVLAAKLASGGADVTIISTWEEHVEVIKQSGLMLQGAGGNQIIRVKATTDPASVGVVSVVIVQCNSNETKAAAMFAKPLVGKNTAVVSFQNGIGNEETLAEVFGLDHVFGGTTVEGGPRHSKEDLAKGVLQLRHEPAFSAHKYDSQGTALP